MGLGAFLAIPGVAPAIGAGLSGFFGWLGNRGQAKATRSAADMTSRAAMQAGQWQQQTAREQLEFMKADAARLALETERAQEANWALERAEQLGRYNLSGDEMANAFALERQRGLMDYGETKADRYNTRQELEANIRREYERWASGQRRVGTLAQIMGTPQPRGGREIAPIEFPGALQQPDLAALPAPQQSPFTFPGYGSFTA
jgi:hypothetical protein